MSKRSAIVTRTTKETRVSIELDVDGSGEFDIQTGIGMLDHLLSHVAKHGVFDITLRATGDLHVDQHHTVEDVAITLGQALSQAIGERKGIVRMGYAVVPMDEALALVAVDLSGRGYAVVDVPFEEWETDELKTGLVRHFLESFASEARLNLHARLLAGKDDHHKAEAVFKALGRALSDATRIEPRRAGKVPSTKGVIEK